MKIFIDSADIEQINEALSWGIVDGITTNPSLIKKAYSSHGDKAGSMKAYIARILEAAGDRPVSLEVIGPSEEDMTRQGIFLYETFNPVAGNVVVKVPVNPNVAAGEELRYDGLRSIRTLSERGIPVNTTLIFTPEQAMCAAKAGAAYVSPFAGRIDDLLRKRRGTGFDKMAYFPQEGLSTDGGPADDNGIVSGVHLVREITRIFQNFSMDCLVLAASLRNPRQVRECAAAGADMATIPFAVIREMLEHEKSVEGMRAFLDDVVPEYRSLLDEGR